MKISRINNFDLLRLLAALQVVFTHGVKHLRLEASHPLFAQLHHILDAVPGVPIFFVISGFLIAKSYESNRNDLRQFFTNRALRLFPALWICFGVTLLILSYYGFVSVKSAATPTFFSWIFAQLTIFQDFTPGFVRGFGVGTPNGSLWTIPVESQFYLMIPVVYWLLGGFRKHSKAMAGLGVLIAGSYLAYLFVEPRHDSSMLMKLLYTSFVPHFWEFLMGIGIYRNFDRLRNFIEDRALVWCALFSVWLFVPESVRTHPVLMFVWKGMLAFTALSLAFTNKHLSEKLLRGNDISYGVYIYHMLVVNVMVQQGYVGAPVYLLVVYAVTVTLAFASWRLIERRALAMKTLGRKPAPSPVGERRVEAPVVEEPVPTATGVSS